MLFRFIHFFYYIVQTPELLALSEMRVSNPLCWQLHLAFVPAAGESSRGEKCRNYWLGLTINKAQAGKKEAFCLGLLDLLFYMIVRPHLEETSEKASFPYHELNRNV